MKRIIAALSLALIAAPAFAEHRDGVFDPHQCAARFQCDGMQGAAPASAGPSAGPASMGDSVWAKDHNFVSPAQ